MDQESNDSGERERQVNEIITTYLEAVDAGQRPDHQEWLRQYPEFTAELEAFLAEYAWVDRIGEPSPPDAAPDAPLPLESVVSGAAATVDSRQPILAQPADESEPAWRWHGWNLLIAGLIAMVLISVVIGAVVSEFFSERGWAGKTPVARRAEMQAKNSTAAAARPAIENRQRAGQTESRAEAGPANIRSGTAQLPAGPAAPTGALAFYTFNGNAHDSSGNDNNGTTRGSPTYVNGNLALGPGQALNFNGSSQDVEVPYTTSFNVNSWTVSAWINLSASAAANVNGILGTRLGIDYTFDMQIRDNNGLVHTDIGDGGVWLSNNADASYTFDPGTWYMVTETVASSGYALYVNGVQIATGSVGGIPRFMQPGQTLSIGQGYGGEYFNGSLQDVSIYGSALSAAQVAALYSSNAAQAKTLPRTAAADSWMRKADFPGTSMRESLHFSIGNKGYVGITSMHDFWEYYPAENSWSRKADLPPGFCFQAQVS